MAELLAKIYTSESLSATIAIADSTGDITVEPLSVTSNGTYDAPSGKAYDPVTVNVPTGTPRSSSDLTVSGATVNVPAGLYSTSASKSVASGAAGTPTATKGAPSNHSITITPSVQNTTGYITGGTKTGTGVTVQASELVSGSETKTSNGTYDVTNLAQLIVNVPTSPSITVEPLSVTSNGTYDAPSGKAYDPVTVNVPEIELEDLEVISNGTYVPFPGTAFSSVTVSVPEVVESVPLASPGVNFYDYDGRCVAAWKASEVASKTALPPNPDHSHKTWHGQSVGLTAKGWSWSLSALKSTMSGSENELTINVGQYYTTSDGKDRLYVRLDQFHLSPWVGFVCNGTTTIDWGDGSTPSTVVSSTWDITGANHTYSEPGEYLVTISGSDDRYFAYAPNEASLLFCKGLNISSVLDGAGYATCVKAVEFGNGIIGIRSCFGLGIKTVTYCRNNFSDQIDISSYLSYCVLLSCAVMPNIFGSSAIFALSGALQTVCSSEECASAANIGESFFAGCTSMEVAPPFLSANSIDYLCYQCYSLREFIVSYTVETIGYGTFSYCASIRRILFLRSTPPTVRHSNVFEGLPTDCIIYVPSGSLNAYESATNYPDPNVYTYVGV